jgi:hypothetical protein
MSLYRITARDDSGSFTWFVSVSGYAAATTRSYDADSKIVQFYLLGSSIKSSHK